MDNIWFIKLMKTKKAQGTEIVFGLVLVIGLLVALAVESLFINYMIVILSGFGMGVLLYQKRNEFRGKYMIACLSFIIGYIVAKSGMRFRLFSVFVLSVVLGYYIYKQFLKTIFSSNNKEI